MITSVSGFCQITQSSCVAADSIKEKYKNDANQLVLRNIYRNELAQIDSIKIPNSRSDTLLRGLLAIYNLDSLKERDTIFDFYDIRAREAAAMTSIYMNVDSSITWVKNIKNGVTPVGEPIIDRLLQDYKMKVDSYFPLFKSNEVMLTFKSIDTNLNITPIVKGLKPLSEISRACTNFQWSSGYDIHDSIHSNHVEYIFSIGGFMPGSVSHYFGFRVYFDCSVEYTGSFTRAKPHWVHNRIETYNTCVTNEQVGYDETKTLNSSILVFPNPANNELNINSSGEGEFSIFSLTGQNFMKGFLSNEKKTISIENLPNGTYFIRFSSNNSVISRKFVKE